MGPSLVGRRFLDKKLPREMLPQITDVLRPHAAKNPEIARLMSEVMKGGLLVSLDPQEVARVRALVRTRGDARRGRELFLNHKALACITCHQLEGVGGNVGPDLTRIWDTMTVEKIMEAIIDPSKEIKEGYQSYVATTRKGQVFVGLKVAQTSEEVVLKDQTGKEIRIRARDLESLTVSKKSLMPEDVVSQLTFNQFIDLIAFPGRDRSACKKGHAEARRPGKVRNSVRAITRLQATNRVYMPSSFTTRPATGRESSTFPGKSYRAAHAMTRRVTSAAWRVWTRGSGCPRARPRSTPSRRWITSAVAKAISRFGSRASSRSAATAAAWIEPSSRSVRIDSMAIKRSGAGLAGSSIFSRSGWSSS